MRCPAISDAGVFTALFLAYLAAQAGPVEDGQNALSRGDYATALRLLRPAAEQGDRDAQFAMGSMYMRGHGVERDDSTAREWFLQAAKRGDKFAQFNTGVFLENGRGGPADLRGALDWYSQAANQDHAGAAHNLGLMYGMGKGVKADYIQAYKWLAIAEARATQPEAKTRAAAQENLKALARLMKPQEIAHAKKLAADWKPRP
jgi:TPR repeat protein